MGGFWGGGAPRSREPTSAPRRPPPASRVARDPDPLSLTAPVSRARVAVGRRRRVCIGIGEMSEAMSFGKGAMSFSTPDFKINHPASPVLPPDERLYD